LGTYQKNGFAVILCYFYPPKKFGHYSVLKNIDKSRIRFYDPFFGAKHEYALTYFKKIWKSDPQYDKEKRWFFAVKKA
jgi:hypothetical protein